MKRRRTPYSNTRGCRRTPNKARYLKAVYAWRVGAYWAQKTGTPLFLYRCECGGWHLTSHPGPDSTKIDTHATAYMEIQS